MKIRNYGIDFLRMISMIMMEQSGQTICFSFRKDTFHIFLFFILAISLR